MKTSNTINWYDQNAEVYASAMQPMPEIMAEFLQSLPAQATILDAGCGGGLDTHLMTEQGFRVTGLDLSEGLLTVAQQNYPESTFVLGDLLDLPFSDQSFCGIWSRASLLHLESIQEVQTALAEFYRVLTLNGLLFVLVKAKTGQPETAVIESSSLVQRHFQYFNQEQLRSLVEEAGFTVSKVTQYSEKKLRVQGRPEVQLIEVWAKKNK